MLFLHYGVLKDNEKRKEHWTSTSTAAQSSSHGLLSMRHLLSGLDLGTASLNLESIMVIVSIKEKREEGVGGFASERRMKVSHDAQPRG